MSFILDALKKSETERQQQASAEFATVPASSGSGGVPRWLWVLALLLAVNLAVLIGLLMRPDPEPVIVEVPAAAPPAEPVAASDDFTAQLEVARQHAPPRQEPVATEAPTREPPVKDEPRVIAASEPLRQSPNTAALPTFHEVVANGTVVLPDLHLDIHVYSDTPEDRFVFINMSKQREQSTLSEGPRVSEITPDGVILDYRGTTFLLPRD